MTKNVVSVLERVIAEIPNTKTLSYLSTNTPQGLEGKVFDFNGPWLDIARRAVEILEKPEEIQEFMRQYIAHLQEKYNFGSVAKATKAVEDTVGYCTGYVDNRKANAWFNALPGIHHPIMGRERPFMEGKSIEGYVIIVKTTDSKIRKYLVRAASEDLSRNSMFPSFSVEPVQGKDNPEYFALLLKLKNRGICADDAEVLLFLKGYAQGMPGRIEEDTGKSCVLTVDCMTKTTS